MSVFGAIQSLAFCAITLPLALLFGNYIAKIFSFHDCRIIKAFLPFERLIYRICGIDDKKEQSWREYGLALFIFNLIGLVFLFIILKLQNFLPLNPNNFPGMGTALAFNTAVSFVTNTNWQAYNGENTLSYFSQMVGLNVQNFLSAATGMAVAIALMRAIARSGVATIGNFYVDLTRSILYIFLPIAIISALLLIWQGVPQNFSDYISVTTIEGEKQLIPQGPVASQEAIKQLGTNGGGFFGANSAHPYENPTPISNLLQVILMLLIPVALTRTYGKMVNDTRQGWTIFAVMALIFIAGLFIVGKTEATVNPVLAGYGLSENMEGKELRFGVAASSFWSVATTATASGSVNSMHDSFMPLSGMVQLVNIVLGEVIFGGVGSGLYGMMIFVIITVFIAGLMVGRTPEYLGKKIEAREIKLAMLAMLMAPIGVLVVGAISSFVSAGAVSIQETGPHGLTELLYAHASATGNNGSAFAGFNANTNYHNIALGIAMLIGRFLFIIPVLGIAGSLVAKQKIPESNGTFPTHGMQFALLLAGIILIIGGLTFFPVLVLGPVLEQVSLR